MAEQPILDLETLVRRPSIVIDGEAYDILSPDELSILDTRRLASQGERLEALLGKEQLTTAEESELGKIILAISARIMVGVPSAIAARLTDSQRLAIIGGFTGLLPKELARPAEAQIGDRAGNQPTGAKSSPGSSASMAASREHGSSARRSPSSGAS